MKERKERHQRFPPVERVPVVILGGADSKKEAEYEKKIVRRSYKEHSLAGEYKGLIEINEKPIVQIVIDAFKSSEYVKDVYLIGPEKLYQNKVKNCNIIDNSTVIEIKNRSQHGSFAYNILKAIEAVKTDSKSGYNGKVVISACDLPLLSHSSVDDIISEFLFESDIRGADLCHPLVCAEAFEQYEHFRDRPALKLRGKEGDERYRLGNIAYMRPEKMQRIFGILQNTRKARKAEDWIVYLRLIGLVFAKVNLSAPYYIAKYYMGRLSIDDINKAASKAFDAEIRLIESDDAAIGIDIDSEEDLMYVRKIIKPKNVIKMDSHRDKK
ncbi:MAG: NTP transferase domain-containing protein [Candidatus Woesearchaeota archaeon]|nr:NTP transferase domain-containing protein [Candidatus Woesearchaeota archaeon]